MTAVSKPVHGGFPLLALFIVLTAGEAGMAEPPEVVAGRLAGLWLDSASAFEAQPHDLAAYSRAQWVEKTMPTCNTLTEPVSENDSRALSDALRDQMPEELKPMLGGAQGMFQQMGGALFGMQLGGAVGTLEIGRAHV